jgi:hypothetical protein
VVPQHPLQHNLAQRGPSELCLSWWHGEVCPIIRVWTDRENARPLVMPKHMIYCQSGTWYMAYPLHAGTCHPLYSWST